MKPMVVQVRKADANPRDVESDCSDLCSFRPLLSEEGVGNSLICS